MCLLAADNILLEHVAATLIGCVTTYSELEVIIDSVRIDSKMGIFDRIKWTNKEKKICDIIQRIQNHKSSLTLMLMILQWYVRLIMITDRS